MVYWYVCMVRTGDEEKVLDLFIRSLDVLGGFKSFLPRKEVQIKRQGKRTKESRICFPGYVFIQSQYPAEVFILESYAIIRRIKKVYKLLSYDNDKYNIAIKDEEKIALSKVMNAEFCIQESIGFVEGDSIRIISGALFGMESKINAVNIHNRTAKIELEMMGAKRLLTVGLEIVEKVY